MSNSLEFKISADDQASRVVETVQNKITNFGRDIAKMALGFAGPLALVQLGFQKIGEYMDDLAKKRQDAIDFGLEGVYEELKARTKTADQLERGYKILLAQAKLAQEEADKAEKAKIAREEATKAFLKNTPRGQEIKRESILVDPESGATYTRSYTELSKIAEIQAEALETTKAITDEENKQTTILAERAARWSALADSVNQYNQQLQQNERSRKHELEYVNRIKKAQSDLLDLQTKQQNLNLYGGSSQAQAGGGFANEQANIAASQQRMMQAQEEASRIQERLAQENIQIANQLYTAAVGLNNGVKDFTKAITEMPSAISDMNLNVGGATFDINSTF